MSISRAKRLESYTLMRPDEVLLVTVETAGEPDQILIYKGFSSSLMQATDFDPEVPVLSEEAIVMSIDRLASPYSENNPQYIQQSLTWQQMQEILAPLKL